ncbi:carbonic anhydrase [Flavobacterium sinopsychrotolerans]|uniref:Carbonic anhydrase n=1 Tax=Flavobacterium sinopsychrotolerans TaxID=604089 RepID=A0A1H8HZE3_9FLAO|nr:carbonic anhydrase [Flavobacterium sinopsychrotolerans]SEN61603.1 carbonic anhydrase [Flavobacterium sinopsychrotolerans]
MCPKNKRNNRRTLLLFVLCPFFALTIFSFIFFKNEKAEEHLLEIKTPDEAIADLKNGNLRFLENKSVHLNYAHEIDLTKKEQHPHTLVLTCIDSRVPPEIIFDQGIGNLFVARVAGNIEDDNILGSMEFATTIKHTKLIVVLGHNHCGAVQGAIDNVGLEHLTQLTSQIKPSINPHKTYPLSDYTIDDTSRKNVVLTIEKIIKKSATLEHQLKNKEIKIIGAYYDITNGKVAFLENNVVLK